jgi:hypothetical protein
MSDCEVTKEKKSKKEKKEYPTEVIDLEASDQIVTETKKSKKEKKEKKHIVDDSAEASECYAVDTTSEKPRKQKKEKEGKLVFEEDPVVELDASPKKEKKSKKEKRAVDDVIVADTPEEEEVKKEKKSKKHKHAHDDLVDLQVELQPKKEKKSKKEKRHHDVDSDEASKPETPSMKTDMPISTPKASQEWSDEMDTETGGAKYWKRIDEEKWKQKVDGTKFAKISHYDKGGDSWGNDAAEILGQVKGKGFVKAMQKLKRASWKGQGQIDTGINSVQFSDWED